MLSLDQVLLDARDAANDIARGLAFATRVGAALPQPGEGQTWLRWSVLAAAGQGDLTAARILEAHSDALAILPRPASRSRDGTWGVFAAEMPGARLDADDHGDARGLTGTKPWCSLGGRLDHALVTAHSRRRAAALRGRRCSSRR